MIIGDEYVVLRAVAGILPSGLVQERLLVTPVTFTRLELSRHVATGPPRKISGQITGRLMELPEDARAAVFNPDERIFTVISNEVLAPGMKRVTRAAADMGFTLNRRTAEFVAAAELYDAVIWFGHDRNVPPLLEDGLVPGSIRFRRLSEIAP